jgi:hypothetical protein
MTEYIRYDEEIQLAICKACQQGIAPGDPTRHFRRQHRATWESNRQTIVDYMDQLTLKSIENLRSYGSKDGTRYPIEGLETKRGWCCGEGECRYCTVSEKSLKNHCRSVHGKESVARKEWFETPMQTLFGSPNIWYDNL